MEPRIIIRDDQCLDELKEAQCFASDSILKVVAHAGAYFDSLIESMQNPKKWLEEQLEQARIRLEEAQEAYRIALQSQQKDEDGNYYPSCDSEAMAVDCCQEEYNELEQRNKEAEQVLSDCTGELSKYREDDFLYTGGEPLMKRFLAQELTDKANEKIDKIRECVSKYLSLPGSIREARLQRSAEQAQLYEEGAKEIQGKAEAEKAQAGRKKTEAFREANSSLQRRMSDMGYRSANAVAVCPGCKRPVNVCICQHILERSR